MTTVVVGVDGSDDAHRALRFAVDEAQLRAARLRVVSAWELPVQNWGEMPPPEENFDQRRRRSEEALAEAGRIVERLAPDLECEYLALEGEAGALLLKHSADASLLVVGRHGHGVASGVLGSIADVLLGSVSKHVVGDARCPVVVVPHGSSPE